MKKLLTETFVLLIAMTIAIGTFAQSPGSSTRQRRTAADGTQPAADTDVKASDDKASDAKTDKTSDTKTDKDKKKQAPEVTADGKTNRTDEASEEEAIVPYYNNFFTNYRLGPEDVISVNVFQQEKYSKQGIKIPPSGRIYLALIDGGLFVNGKTPDQVAELIKKRYDEFIIGPQVSVSLDQAGSYRYSVVGDVSQPGNRSKIVVLRKQQDGTLKPIPVNLTAVYKGQTPDSVYLVPGDQVIVPGNTLKKLQTIMGFTQVLTFANLFRGGLF